MNVVVETDAPAMGRRAATIGADAIRAALRDHGKAAIVVATGASQFEVLRALVAEPDIAWNHVTAFHLDEYVGLPITHPASFRHYLWERFVRRLPLPLAAFHYIDGEADPAKECARLSALIRRHAIDVAFVGIGENGHLAFNDPPADFETTSPYLTVSLDEACRRQQHGEGWFPTLDDVPTRAISMSCHQILESRLIVCSAPDQRKAKAVAATVQGPVTPEVPASILQTHDRVELLLDSGSASLLHHDTIARIC
ncbi:MAG TPA: glucosamine-6-phosphate deaminase [Kiritimatiellia bacterium]|nr:glucosamine-6-phosphate deaminase [Kiritimatiellia bacterium]